jgi:leucyl aminopeptidase (aminopeptidase T)
MDIDPTKAPRTHATWKKAYDVKELAKLMVELSVQLEVELNVATVNEVFAENKVHILEKELEKANDRIKRLEEIINRASLAFFSDASHRKVSIAMHTILEEFTREDKL